MNKKTPRFNDKIKELLADAQPDEKICQATDKKFTLRPEDIEFYKLLNVPLPVFCPEEMSMRGFAHCVSLEFFMRRPNGSNKETTSNIDPECPLIIYEGDRWWSDNFDAADYALEYRSEKDFFTQLQKLRLTVPRPALYSFKKPTGHNELSLVFDSNNCYRAIGGPNLENVMFCNGVINSRDCAEIFMSGDCELCYQMFECIRCYNCTFLDTCVDCIDCHFGYDLRHCENCFGSNNLRYKKYCFFNEQLTREEYEERISNINLGSRKEQENWLKTWEKTRSRSFRLDFYQTNSDNCFGNYIFNSSNCFKCVEVTKSQDVAYSFYAQASRSIRNADSIVNSEMIVGSRTIIDSFDIKFSYDITDSSQVEYSEFCHHVENCFGCVGLRNKKFYILNKPYKEDDYWKKVDQIKCDMLERGEYGKPFPLEYVLYAYNLSVAPVLFPLTKEEARNKKIRWYDLPLAPAKGALSENEVPDDIRKADDKIIGMPISCRETRRLFSIVGSELDFYRRINVPIPTEHHRQRWATKRFHDQSIEFIDSQCNNCRASITTLRFKNRKEKVLCRKCYNKIVEEF